MLLALTTLGVFAGFPLDTLHYQVWNHGRVAGEMRVVRAGDSASVRFRYRDRQRGPQLETSYRFGSGGAVLRLERRGLSADMRPTAVSERYEVVDGMARWSAGSDSGRVPFRPAAFFRPRSTTPYDDALLAAHLLSRPERSAGLLPAGEARAWVAADTTLRNGAATARVRFVLIDGLGFAPDGVWLDDQDRVFSSSAGWFITIRDGWEAALPALRAIELGLYRQRSDSLARALTRSRSGPLVIRNGDVFDSERGVLLPRTTVVVDGERITQVGPAEAVRIPAGATVIDASGKTVIPGMWDMHVHFFQTDEISGAMQLAAGITSVRDLAADIDAVTSARDRAAAGTLLAPRMLLAGFIEGPGAWAGPTEVLVRTEAEARAWVARYDSLGYRQIKLYNLVHPDLLPGIAEEATRRGMRLSGHVLRGLSVPAAVRLGYDEIQHAAFLFSTFYQDSLYLPRMRAYSQVAADVAPTFNPEAPQVTALLGLLRERGTVIDGTWNIWQDRSVPLPDGTDAVFGPTLAWLPSLPRRALTPGPPGSPEAAGRALAASDNYRRMLKRAFDAGITLVPGTDNVAGLSYHGELEVYERAGIPAAQVLQIATIVPARVMKEDSAYGSIVPGKVADLVIVAGRPHERISDLRRIETTIRAGRVYSSRELYAAAGITPGR